MNGKKHQIARAATAAISFLMWASAASAFTIATDGTSGGNPGGQTKYKVSGLVQGDSFNLSWAHPPAGLSASGMLFIDELTANDAKIRIMIDNNNTPEAGANPKGNPRITSMGISVENIDTNNPLNSAATGGTFLTNASASNFPGFMMIDVCGTSGNNCAGGGNGGIPVTSSDEITLDVHSAVGFAGTLTLDSFGLKIQGGPGGASFELAGEPTSKSASLTIVKDTVPDDTQNFEFDPSTNLQVSNFFLDDDDDGSLPNTMTFPDLDPDTYTVGEVNIPTGFTLSDITCVGDTDSVVTITTTDVEVELALGENVTCTFTNTKDNAPTAEITVTKILVPSDDPGRFNLQVDGDDKFPNATHNDSTGTVLVDATASHTVGEAAGTDPVTDLADYETVINCEITDANGNTQGLEFDGAQSDPFDVEEDDVVQCTITNTRKTGTLKVVKVLDPADDPGLFDLQINGDTEATDATDGDTTMTVSVPSGFNSVGEVAGTDTDLADYTSSIECRDLEGLGEVVASEESPVTLPVDVKADADVVCTITNQRRPTIEVIKVLDPTDDPGLFNLQIDSMDIVTDVTNNGTTGVIPVDVGMHTVGESAGTGTDLADYDSEITCIDQDDDKLVDAESGTTSSMFDLDAGDQVTCTVTNPRLPPLACNAPGSVVVLPFVLNSKTVLRLTNHGDDDVDVHLVRVCGGEKSFGGQGFCTASDRELSFTPMQTRIVNVESFFSVDPVNCPSGFVLAFTEDDSLGVNQPISWNFLTGSVHLRDNGSGRLTAAAAQGCAIQANAAPGDPVGTGGAFPRLPFTGKLGEFRAPTGTAVTDFRAASGSGVTKKGSLLHLITLDIQAGAQNDPTLVALDWTNQGEVPFSGSLEYVCQVRVPLEEIPGAGGSFTSGSLGSAFGKLEIEAIGSDGILGFIEERENNRQTLRPLFRPDDAPRPTEFIGR